MKAELKGEINDVATDLLTKETSLTSQIVRFSLHVYCFNSDTYTH